MSPVFQVKQPSHESWLNTGDQSYNYSLRINPQTSGDLRTFAGKYSMSVFP